MLPDISTADLFREFEQIRPSRPSDSAVHRILAERHGYSTHTIRKKLWQYKKKLARQIAQEAKTRSVVPFPEIPTYVYTGEAKEQPAIPLFTGAWNFTLDEMMITGDLHVLTINRPFVELMCRVAERHMNGHRRLLIAGDAVNGDKDSVHANFLPPPSRAMEFDYICRLIDYLLSFFDQIDIMPGNHLRKRLLALLDGDLNMNQLKRLMTTKPDQVNLSPYDITYITSGGLDWVITHQYEYSRNKLTKANRLAQKYQRNVITFHQHHTAVGMDEFGRYVCVDCGGMHDSRGMAYVNIVPNTMPVMNNAFVFLKQGTANLITPYRGMTNMQMWLPEAS